MKKFSEIYERFIALGADEQTSKNELKRIKLFNGFCLVWYLIAVSLVLSELVSGNVVGSMVTLRNHLPFCVVISIAQFLISKKKYELSYSIFILCLLATCFIFSNMLSVGELTEYYYLLVPPIALVFFDNNKINYIILILALLGFVVPNYIYNYYPEHSFDELTNPLLLISVFIIVNYFKNLNIKNEKALKLKTEELEELDEFKSQFFTNISHEIRTPLTLIKGEIDDLKEVAKFNSDVLKVQLGVNNQVEKITKIINDVLDLAKMETSDFKLNLKKASVTNLLKKIYVNFEPIFKQKNVHFFLNIDNKNYFSEIDTLFLERALNNIVVNALKYTDSGGKVVLELKHIESKLLVSIVDSGIGISDEGKQKIFDRFYQIDNDINRAGGSGIGLAFSKEIIELHNGKIYLDSKLGQGSDFTIELPLKEVKKEGLAVETQNFNTKKVYEKEFKLNTSTSKVKKILVVDDNREMRQYLISILKKYNCIEAENGVEALQKLQKNSVDFIVTDYMMPKLNGYGFIKTLRKENYDIPVLMLTAKTDTKSKIDVLKLGIDDYVVKPFEKEELLVRIENSLHNQKKKNLYNSEYKLSENVENEEENQTLIQKLAKYIQENIHKTEISQEQLSNYFNVSKSTLYRKIKSETGLSPNEFIVEIKLQRARELLNSNPDILMKQLALEVGYQHTSYFSKIFYKRFGIKKDELVE